MTPANSAFLASLLAAYITGTLVVADGGQNLPGSGAWTQLIMAEMAKAGKVRQEIPVRVQCPG